MRVAQDAARGELMFQALAVLAICLSTFNLYLLGWLWLGSGGGPWAQMELLTQWRHLKFKGLVVSSGLLKLAQVSGRASVEGLGDAEERSQMGTANKLSIKADRFFLQPLEITTTNSKQHPSNTIQHQPESLLSIADGQMNFSHGLQAEGAFYCPNLGARNSRNLSPTHTCIIKAPHLLFSQPKPLDMNHKSLQLTRLYSRRLHAPIGQLKLLSLKGLHFRSSSRLQVEALDRLSLMGQNVILNSSYVDVSSLKRAISSKGSNSYYKLCVCLPSRRPHQPPDLKERNHSPEVATRRSSNTREQHRKWGLVFAVQVGLACGDLSAVCMVGPT